jgi:predicted membrane chloride channel (bestrophin family)
LWADLVRVQEIATKRRLVRDILSLVRASSAVEESISRVKDCLKAAETLRVELGSNPALRSALELIEARALQGVEAAGTRFKTS